MERMNRRPRLQRNRKKKNRKNIKEMMTTTMRAWTVNRKRMGYM